MRNLKKLFAVVLVIAVMLTAMVPAFAETTTTDISADAKACATLGMLLGGNDGVTYAYTQEEPARIQAAIMLIRLKGAEADAKKATGDNFSDVTAGWMKPYTAYLKANPDFGFAGVGNNKFDPNSKIDAKQYYSVLLTALGYKGDYTWDTVATKAAEVGLKKLDGVSKVKIADIAAATVEALKTKVKGSDKTLAADLVAKGVFTNDTAIAAGVIAATPKNIAVSSVTANNLRQVAITFNKPVDKGTAEDASNYTLAGTNNPVVDSASLSADGLTVTLTLKGAASASFANQIEYKLTFNNVRSADKTEIAKASDYKFTPVDSTIPYADKAEALGNQTVKLTFNEPMNTAATSSFTLDGNVVVGYVSISGNDVILKLFNKLTNGEHKLNVKNVADFAVFKSLSKDYTFTVVEDTVAPTIVSASNVTFEKVTIKFSESVDDSTVIGSNVYWQQGSTKYYADYSVSKKSSDTYEFTFSGTNKLQYATDLIVNGVKDYSGNTLATDSKVAVSPVLDTTRPEVISAEIDDAHKVLTVKYSKSVDKESAEKGANYVFKKSDGTEVSALKTLALQSDNKVVKVTLATALDAGTAYTLTISGVSDNTTLKNTMLPYTLNLTTNDKAGVKASDINAYTNIANNSIVVSFGKVMATSGDGAVVDSSKYLYFNGTEFKALPDGTTINITADGKAVILYFPADTAVTTASQIRVQLVKDTAGNYIQGLTVDKTLASATAPTLTGYKATATNKIELTFDMDLVANTINVNDFSVVSGSNTLSVVNAVAGDKASKVILTLADATKLNEDGTYGSSNTAATVAVKANATTSTAAGKAIAVSAAQTITDGVAASVDTVVGSVDGSTITVNFKETLATVATPAANVQTDLVIKDKDGNTLIPTTDYTAAVSGKALTVTFIAKKSGVMSIAIPNPRFIKDLAGNTVATAAKIEVTPDNAVPVAASATPLTVANAGVTVGANSGDTITIKFSEPIDATKLVIGDLKLSGTDTFGAGASIAPTTGTSDTFTITLGTAPVITSGATITVPAAKVIDQAGQSGAADIVFTINATEFAKF